MSLRENASRRTGRRKGSRMGVILIFAVALGVMGLAAFEVLKRRADRMPDTYHEVELTVAGMH